VQKDLNEKLEKLGAEFQEMIMGAQRHVCGEGCDCEKGEGK
jgi:hypothetical protein